jgi:hypothetical protein
MLQPFSLNCIPEFAVTISRLLFFSTGRISEPVRISGFQRGNTVPDSAVFEWNMSARNKKSIHIVENGGCAFFFVDIFRPVFILTIRKGME